MATKDKEQTIKAPDNVAQLPVATKETSVLVYMAEKFGMQPAAFEQTLRATVMPSDKTVSKEQFAAFLLVAKEYDLNPLTKEIYAFPGKNNSIQPIVSIDGWLRMINQHPQMNGMEFIDHKDEKGKLTAVTCRIYRKDRDRPVEVTEYMSECARGTEPWQKWPARMLRHKATIQGGRYAFGFSGIYDQDEIERMHDVTPADEQPKSRTDEVLNKLKRVVPQDAEVIIEPEPGHQQPEQAVVDNEAALDEVALISDVEKMIKHAKNEDDVSGAMALAGDVKDGEQRKRLIQLATERMEELNK